MRQTLEYNEDQLLIHLKEGSEEAFTQIFDHYQGKIYGVALQFLRSPALAEEIVQDVFLKLWLKRTELPVIRRLDDYLFIMARNLVFDRLKKASYEADALTEFAKDASNIDDAEYLVRQHQCQQLLQEIIERLPPQQRQVYQMARTGGLSHQKIAEKMQLSRLTIKSHMASALQSIRKYLNTHLPHILLFPIVVSTVIFNS